MQTYFELILTFHVSLWERVRKDDLCIAYKGRRQGLPSVLPLFSLSLTPSLCALLPGGRPPSALTQSPLPLSKPVTEKDLMK